MSEPKSITRWNIVRKAENGLYYLEIVEFEPGCSGAIVFTQIQQLCLPQRKAFGNRVSYLLCSPVVYISTVMEEHNSIESKDAEAQPTVREVFVKNKRYSEAYTLALRDPVNFGEEMIRNFLVNRTRSDAGRKCERTIRGLLVVQEIRRAKVVVFFGALALLSVGIGCVAGLVSGKVDQGVSVAAGLFQFLTILQWSYIWAARK